MTAERSSWAGVFGHERRSAGAMGHSEIGSGIKTKA